MNLSADQLDTLRHMLGINTPHARKPKPYRNYFCANPCDSRLLALECLGAIECYRRDTYHWYRCTSEGYAAAMRSHRAIRYKKSSRVYSAYLNAHDCMPDLTFKQFLTDRQFAETRRNA